MPKCGDRRRIASLLASFLLHCFLIFLLLHRPAIFVKPSSVAWGLDRQSERLIYFPPPAAERKAVSKKPAHQFKPDHKPPQEIAPSVEESARAGTSSGSDFQGRAVGTEARPALPLVFPDPTIYPWQLPRGLQGDVIVEVVIDAQGNVTETRVLQSLQPAIDEKVIATLRNWRFRPATVDGVAISSRQDVHFHFPS